MKQLLHFWGWLLSWWRSFFTSYYHSRTIGVQEWLHGPQGTAIAVVITGATMIDKLLLASALCFYAVVANAVTIREVIQQGIDDILVQATTTAVDPATTPNILAAFNKIKQHHSDELFMLRVVSAGQLAVTANDTIVVHRSIDTLSTVEIEFIIAHEAGHIRKKHKELRIAAYEKHLQGEVTEAKAKIANMKIGPELKAISWQGEFEADREALMTLTAIGRSKDDVLNAFLAMNRTPDTATHPSTARRMMNLKRED